MSFGLPFNYIHNFNAAQSSGSMSAKGDRYADRRQLEQQRNLNALQAEQEKNLIIGRTDAAKAAGIHPLVAMGAQVGATTVSAPAPSSDPGIGYVDVGSKTSQPSSAQKRIENANADLAELNVELARKRLASQPGNGGAPNQHTGDNMVVPGEATPHPVSHVKIEGQSLPPASLSKSYQTPGVAPGWDVVQIGEHSGGKPLRMVVPGGSVQRENWGEQMGELPFYLLPEVVRQSAEASGLTIVDWLYRVGAGPGAETWRSDNHRRNMSRQPK